MKVRVAGLTYRYYKKNVLKDISFTINQGDMYCVLGKNASGKTTLIKCINKLLSLSSGNIFINNKNINNMSRKEIAKLIAFIPQEHKLSFDYNVYDFVAMGRYPHLNFLSKPSRKDYEIAFSNMKDIGIENLAFRNYNELSGGEKQLVLTARALSQEPKMFILDEPTSHLDFKNQHKILKLIKNLATKKNLSVLFTMHDPNLALKFCDKFLILKDGKVLADGLAENILNEENLSNIYDMKINIRDLDKNIKIILPND